MIASAIAAAATVILVACTDDAVDSGGGVNFDGGTLTLPETSTTLPVVDAGGDACSGCAEVGATLAGLRWSLPCKADFGGAGTTACTVTDPATQTVSLVGEAGGTYDVTVRLRGVIELEKYKLAATAGPAATGTNASFFVVGATPANDGNNVYRLDVSAPALTAYLNYGPLPPTYCYPIDYSVTVPMQTGASISLFATAGDGVEQKNHDANNQPIVIPDVAPAPAAFAGQFVQMDVVGVTKRP